MDWFRGDPDTAAEIHVAGGFHRLEEDSGACGWRCRAIIRNQCRALRYEYPHLAGPQVNRVPDIAGAVSRQVAHEVRLLLATCLFVLIVGPQVMGEVPGACGAPVDLERGDQRKIHPRIDGESFRFDRDIVRIPERHDGRKHHVHDAAFHLQSYEEEHAVQHGRHRGFAAAGHVAARPVVAGLGAEKGRGHTVRTVEMLVEIVVRTQGIEGRRGARLEEVGVLHFAVVDREGHRSAVGDRLEEWNLAARACAAAEGVADFTPAGCLEIVIAQFKGEGEVGLQPAFHHIRQHAFRMCRVLAAQ